MDCRNIPTDEADLPSLAEVTVQDSGHALYGRRFRVLRLLARRGSGLPPCFEVEHRDGCTLLIPVRVTEPVGTRENRTKLSVEGLRELISLAEQLEEHADRPGTCVGGTSGGNASAGHRGCRRGSGGDVP